MFPLPEDYRVVISSKDNGSRREFRMGCVVDADMNGPIGIELIGPKAQATEQSAPFDGVRSRRESFPAVTYDSEADALYVRLRPGRSLDQLTAIATVVVDASGSILEITVDRSPEG